MADEKRNPKGKPTQYGRLGTDRRSGHPAPRPGGERRSSARPAGPRQEGEKRVYDRPAAPPRQEGEKRVYGRPAAPCQEGEKRVYGRPAALRQEGEKRVYGRPAGPRPDRPRPDGPTFSAPQVFSLSLDARRSALLVLNRVLNESGYAALSLDDHFKSVRLSPQDKRLCTRIVYQTLENLGRIDFALNSLLEEPERLEKRVRNLLRLSACQILLLDRVPDSAVVNEAVKITRDMGLEDMTGLVNGVLRNLIRKKDDIAWPVPEEGSRYYEIMHSQPAWLVEQLQKDYGEDEAHRILTWQPADHRITIRPNLMRKRPQGMEELLKSKGWRYEKGQMPQAWYVYGAADITRDPDYLAGTFSIQGEGSMLAAEAVQAGLGQQVLDTCAAPGGKTAYMAEQMQGTGRVQAWDVHEHRVELIRVLAERLRLYNIRPAVRDALVYREQLETMMDAVLIDAPCTGTGVLADKPDLKQRVNEESLHQLLETQRRLLDTCSRYVKPGGTLVYATCSLLPDENQRQVESFLLIHPAFEMISLPDSIPAKLRAAQGPLGLQLLPHRDGVEGFYVARMRRK